MQKHLEEAINGILPNEWKNCCKHARELEDEAWKRDDDLEQVMEPVVISFSEESTGSTCTSDDCEAPVPNDYVSDDEKERHRLSVMLKEYEDMHN